MPIEEGSNKYNTGRKSVVEDITKVKNIEIGEVVSIEDPNALGRIKIRIKGPASKGGDDNLTDADLPWAFPLLPKFFGGKPKVKEAVYVFVFSSYQTHADRMYLGPIISQPQQLNFDPFYITALGGFTFGNQTPTVSYQNIPAVKGVFPDESDISIQGRDNTDLWFKSNEVLIRAGKFVKSTPDTNNPFNFKFNATTQAYIQIKNDTVIQPKTDTEAEIRGTITNIIANKINLLTHKDGAPRFNLTNQDNLISDDEMLNILATAHPLVFGDILIEYLKLLKDALFYHVHNGNGNQPTDLTASGNKQALATFKKRAEDLENQMLSKNIRIN